MTGIAERGRICLGTTGKLGGRPPIRVGSGFVVLDFISHAPPGRARALERWVCATLKTLAEANREAIQLHCLSSRSQSSLIQ